MHNIHAAIIKPGPLSAKEAVVLRFMCEGYCRKEIAGLVFRSVSTVGTQIESIAEKLDCHCAAEIVATAVAAGLVTIEITNEHGLFMKFMIILLLVNITSSHMDLRRGPRSPRPVRTMRASSRLVRRQEQC